jgi:pimeloyl-ACP methyl ester carboxylesterase
MRSIILPSGRFVGYRRFGEGPPAVLLHSSPRSSASMLKLGLRLAGRHTVFAVDSPGFGWSDELKLPRPDADDFGDALIEVFDALGIARAAVYGSHTGAAIAVAAAGRHPTRISALALDGYPIFTPAVQGESLASYLAPIRPGWDGTHLAFLWSRVSDQFTVFPWYLNAQVARIGRSLAPLSAMQDVIVDFLAAGDSYRAGYAAAFRYEGNRGLQALTVPTTVLARSDDALFSHVDAVHDVPDCVVCERLGADDDEWVEAMHVALSRGAAQEITVPEQPDATMFRVPGGTIGIRRHNGTGTGTTVVVLPGIPGSARGEVGLARALASSRPVCVVDLPGFGASSLPGAQSVGDIADAIAAALEMCGITEWDLVALGESDAIAGALRERHPGRLVLVDPIPQADRAGIASHMTDIAPSFGGGHLLAAWHQLRNATRWRPWFQTDPAHAIPNGTDPDVGRMHAILTDWMRGGTAGRRTLEIAMQAPMPEIAASLLLSPDHPWSTTHAALAEIHGWPVAHAADDRRARAAAILALLQTPLPAGTPASQA